MKDWEDNLEKEMREILRQIIKNLMITSKINPQNTQVFGYEKIEITLPNGKRIIKEQRYPPTFNNYMSTIDKTTQTRQESQDFLSDVIKTANEVIVIAEVPTLDEKDISFHVENGKIKIFCRGQLIHEIEIEKEIDTSNIKKNFKNRILELRMPLKVQTK